MTPAPVARLFPQSTPSFLFRKEWRYASWLILGLGLLLRVVVWGQQRSIVLDEANLLRNYTEKTYDQLFQSLDYEQYAPPLFSVVVKACLAVFGNNELSARLFPLLCSLATLVLFRRLAGRWLPPALACLALGFVGFGYIFIDYATECKQYATDGLVALALLEAAHWAMQRRFSSGLALALAGLGMVAIWLSMPAVFVLAGIGLWWLVQSVRQHDQRRALLVLGMSASWAASFLAYFLLLLSVSAKQSNLQTFHQDYFLAFPPRSGAQLHLLADQLRLMADRAIGKTVLAAVVAAIGFGVGVWHIVRRRDEAAWFFLVPIGTCLAASAAHYYSLVPRLTLFFLPLVVLVVFMGLAALATRPVPAGLVLVLGIVVLGNQQRLRNLATPFYADYAEVRTGLEYIARHRQASDKAFMNFNVAPIARYYTSIQTPPLRLGPVVLQQSPTGTADEAGETIRQLRREGPARVWLLYDRADESLSQAAAAQGQVLQRFNFERGYVLLVDLK